MIVTPIPTPGSSGGPIIDLENGAVVGVVRGSRMDNRIAGLKGWATSAESIYEVFLALFSLQANQLASIIDVPLARTATKKLIPMSYTCIFPKTYLWSCKSIRCRICAAEGDPAAEYMSLQ